MTGGRIKRNGPILAGGGARRQPGYVTAGPVMLSRVKIEQKETRSSRPSLLYYTLYFIYKNLYILGVQILRRKLRMQRAAARTGDTVWEFLMNRLYEFGLASGRAARDLSMRARAPFSRIGEAWRRQAPAIRAGREAGQSVWTQYLPVAEAVGRLVLKVVMTCVNYSVPVLAALFLLSTIDARLDQTYGLLMEYNGQEIGYVSNESNFDTAAQAVRDRMTDGDVDILPNVRPTFQLKALEPGDTIIDVDDLPDLLIQASGSEVEEAYGFYVSNQFLGAVTDKDAILGTLNQIKESSRTGKQDERIDFVKSVRLKPGLYPVDSLVPSEQVITRLNSNETETETYTVTDGDTPTGIADKLRIPYSQLKTMNPGIETELAPGMELLTTVARPFMSVKTIYTDVYEEEVPYETIEVENAVYAKSYRNVEQEGANGIRRVTAEITTFNGQEIDREIIGTPVVVKEAVPERVTVGANVMEETKSSDRGTTASGSGTTTSGSVATDMTPKAATSGFMWPTTGGYATTYRGHSGNGVDIAIGHGVPIYASRSGTVVKVVYGYTGYGQYIIINHGDGYETLYAHNSDMYVSVGDQVAQGQVIAAMGRTGWATGNHVHFEVRYNGRYLNPYDYIGYSG